MATSWGWLNPDSQVPNTTPFHYSHRLDADNRLLPGQGKWAKMRPNAPINKMTYQAGLQNRKWLSEAAQCAATMEIPEPTCQGVTKGLGDLRFPLRTRPVSARVGGWVVCWAEGAD